MDTENTTENTPNADCPENSNCNPSEKNDEN